MATGLFAPKTDCALNKCGIQQHHKETSNVLGSTSVETLMNEPIKKHNAKSIKKRGTDQCPVEGKTLKDPRQWCDQNVKKNIGLSGV